MSGAEIDGALPIGQANHTRLPRIFDVQAALLVVSFHTRLICITIPCTLEATDG